MRSSWLPECSMRGWEKDVERSLKLFSKAAASGHDLSYRFMEDIRRRQNTQFVTIDGA